VGVVVAMDINVNSMIFSKKNKAGKHKQATTTNTIPGVVMESSQALFFFKLNNTTTQGKPTHHTTKQTQHK